VSIVSCSVLSMCINRWFIFRGTITICDNEFVVQVYVPNKAEEVMVFEACFIKKFGSY
jgi:hypothetical protein